MTELQIERLRKIDLLQNAYLSRFVEDGQDGSDFDCFMLDMFDDMREWVHPSSDAELGHE